MQIFTNPNATNAEKELFLHAGFYKTKEDTYHSKYVKIQTNKTDKFPDTVTVKSIEHEMTITFYHMTKEIKCVGIFDAKTLELIQARMKELG